jgi:WD40 repeat-containing protein SMU1
MLNQLVKSFNAAKEKIFTAAAISSTGKFLYLSAEDKRISCFSLSNLEVVSEFKASEGEIIGLKHHPFSNILSVYSDDGIVEIFK